MATSAARASKSSHIWFSPSFWYREGWQRPLHKYPELSHLKPGLKHFRARGRGTSGLTPWTIRSTKWCSTYLVVDKKLYFVEALGTRSAIISKRVLQVLVDELRCELYVHVFRKFLFTWLCLNSHVQPFFWLSVFFRVTHDGLGGRGTNSSLHHVHPMI